MPFIYSLYTPDKDTKFDRCMQSMFHKITDISVLTYQIPCQTFCQLHLKQGM